MTKLKNSFGSYKSDFQNDTGINRNLKPEAYIEYVKARELGDIKQILALTYGVLANDIKNAIKERP